MNWKFSIFALTINCCLVQESDSANILVVMPLRLRSHFKSFQPLFEELVIREHNLTIIAGFQLNDKFQSNYTLVDVKPFFKKSTVAFAEMRKFNRISKLMFLNNAAQDYFDKILSSSIMQKLINSNNKYDLVIGEMYFIDAIFALGNKFNAPVIAVRPDTMLSYHNWILGNPFTPSYIPNSYLPLAEKMSLPARIVNVVFNLFAVLFYELVSLPRSQAQIEKYFHFEKGNVPHIKDIMRNISVTLVNSHFSFGYVKPELPNVVNVAGLHFTSPIVLPKDVQKFMDEAEHGVIYLSLGSIIEPDKVEHLGKVFLHVMEGLPQRVVMKWDPKLLTHIPKNFLVQEWFSQTDILNHSKCRLFITHGGLHSLLESLNASVPFIGIPFFTDQQYNMATAEYHEIGTTVTIDNISNELPLKIKEVLHNPKYKENIMKRSLLFRERSAKPLETAMYWIDHVLKHKNTAHLKPGSAYLFWYELYSVDVLVILVFTIWISITIFKFFIGIIKQKLTSMKSVLLPVRKSSQKIIKLNNLKCD